MKYRNPRHDYKVDGKELEIGELGKKTTPKPYKRGGRVHGFEAEGDEADEKTFKREVKRG